MNLATDIRLDVAAKQLDAQSHKALSTLCAIVTSYRPDAQFAARFAEIANQCLAVVVVDNTPNGHRFEHLADTFFVLQDGRNKGLGQALNLGIEKARQLGGNTVVLFDQDSTPTAALLIALHSKLTEARTCVGPTHLDDQAPRSVDETPCANAVSPLRTMTCLPTSGMMFPIRDWDATHNFSEDLFLDFVDFDWCWRMRLRGWNFYRASDVTMLHRLGLGQRRLFGLTYHIPAPYRHYFQFRDTLRIVPRRYVPLYSKLRLLALLPLKLLAYPWLLDRGVERLRWMLRGVADALRGRGGAGAAATKLGA